MGKLTDAYDEVAGCVMGTGGGDLGSYRPTPPAHVHDWTPAGVVGVYHGVSLYADTSPPRYVDLQSMTDRIAVLMLCGCGAVGTTVLDQRNLVAACKAGAATVPQVVVGG